MTLKELLTFLEGYYGEKYSGIFLDVMVSYLEGRPGDFYKAVAQVLVRRYSRSFNKAPGPAEIEKHLHEIYETFDKINAVVALPEPKETMTEEENQLALEFIRDVIKRCSGKSIKGRRNQFYEIHS